LNFSDAFSVAFSLVWSLDSDLVEIVSLSMWITFCAVSIAALIGIPAGAALAVFKFPGRGLCIVIINAFMGLPPVVVGLTLYILFSSAGSLGVLNLLYTPKAMIIAQCLLVTPILIALTRDAIAGLLGEFSESLQALHASRLAIIATLLWEGRFALVMAMMVGLGRALAEVGAVMIVGGNINHVTRVMTTAIALETSRGALELALGLGFVLVSLTLVINGLVYLLGHPNHRHNHG